MASSSPQTPIPLGDFRFSALDGISAPFKDHGKRPLRLGIDVIDAVLPDEGLPRGAVVEFCSPAGLGRATQLALGACATAQRGLISSANDTTLNEKSRPWCAWLDTSHTLFAPGAIRAGVDLERLLVIRPDINELARIAVRVTTSRLFSVVVIDRCGVPGAELGRTNIRWDVAVRRLALAIEKSDTTIVLLSTTHLAQAQKLPVALRVELQRPGTDRLLLRVSKERQGRVRGPIPIPLTKLQTHV